MNLVSKKLFQTLDDTQDNNTLKTFQVPIGNAKCVESFKFQNEALILKYCQKILNSCCFGSLSPAFDIINHFNSANAISMRIEKSLKSEVDNRIDFANDILKNKKINVGEARVKYNLIKYKKMREYKMLEDISENFTLVQFMYSLGNVNHAISVFGNWIFDLNYEKALVLNRESLDMICAPSVGEEQGAIFETVFTAAR